MATDTKSILPTLLERHAEPILAEWTSEQLRLGARQGAASEASLRREAQEFLRLLRGAAHLGAAALDSEGSQPLRELLSEVSRARATQGYTPTETATFVFSLKKPLFSALQRELGGDAQALGRELWHASELLDRLGLFTTEVHQKAREAVVQRQQEEMLELSTPVVKIWDGVVALPMIGTLDSNRTQVVMETLLQNIVDTGSQIAIIDITGVPTVDTLVAQHLMKTIAAAKLMGADCIISGIRPQIAQTIVHLGIDLGGVTTRANMADALKEALRRVGTELHALGRQG